MEPIESDTSRPVTLRTASNWIKCVQKKESGSLKYDYCISVHPDMAVGRGPTLRGSPDL